MELKRVQVKFGTGLPLGRYATFTHDGERWIAYPADKEARIVAVLDRMLGLYARITDDVVRCLNDHPDDAELRRLAVVILGPVQRAREAWADIAAEKVRAVTS